jgi:hypothetical protein
MRKTVLLIKTLKEVIDLLDNEKSIRRRRSSVVHYVGQAAKALVEDLSRLRIQKLKLSRMHSRTCTGKSLIERRDPVLDLVLDSILSVSDLNGGNPLRLSSARIYPVWNLWTLLMFRRPPLANWI